jgi:hypothetical protein
MSEVIARLRNGHEVVGVEPVTGKLVIRYRDWGGGTEFSTTETKSTAPYPEKLMPPTVDNLEAAGLLDAENAAKLRAYIGVPGGPWYAKGECKGEAYHELGIERAVAMCTLGAVKDYMRSGGVLAESSIDKVEQADGAPGVVVWLKGTRS